MAARDLRGACLTKCCPGVALLCCAAVTYDGAKLRFYRGGFQGPSFACFGFLPPLFSVRPPPLYSLHPLCESVLFVAHSATCVPRAHCTASTHRSRCCAPSHPARLVSPVSAPPHPLVLCHRVCRCLPRLNLAVCHCLPLPVASLSTSHSLSLSLFAAVPRRRLEPGGLSDSLRVPVRRRQPGARSGSRACGCLRVWLPLS